MCPSHYGWVVTHQVLVTSLEGHWPLALTFGDLAIRAVLGLGKTHNRATGTENSYRSKCEDPVTPNTQRYRQKDWSKQFRIPEVLLALVLPSTTGKSTIFLSGPVPKLHKIFIFDFWTDHSVSHFCTNHSHVASNKENSINWSFMIQGVPKQTVPCFKRL